MSNQIKVALSPFFGGKKGFKDEVSGIHFTHGGRGEIQVYDITNETKLEGIRSALRLNVLMLLEGTLDSEQEQVTVVEEPKVEAPVVETPEEVVVVETPLEDGTLLVEEVAKEAPKAKQQAKKK